MKKHIKKLVAIMTGGIAAISLIASTHKQENVECHAAGPVTCTWAAHQAEGCTVTHTQGTVSDCIGYDPGPYQNSVTNGTQNCTWTETHSLTGLTYNRPHWTTPQRENVNACEDECYPN